MEQRPTVCFWGNPDELSLPVVENLLADFCRVKIISQNPLGWKDKLSHLSENRFLDIGPREDKGEALFADYVLVLDNKLEIGIGELVKAVRVAKVNAVKILVVFPYSCDGAAARDLFEKKLAIFKKSGLELGVLYVGDVLGTRTNLSSGGFFPSLIKNALWEKKIKLPTQETSLFPVTSIAVSKEIVRSLFSFGPYGEEAAYLGREISVYEFFETVAKILPGKQFTHTGDFKIRYPKEWARKTYLPIDLTKALHETFSWVSTHPEIVTEKKRRIKQEEFKKTPNPKTIFTWSLGVVLFAVFLPFFLLSFSSGLTLFAKNKALAGDLDLAKKSLSVSGGGASFAKKQLTFYSEIPAIGGIFKGAVGLASLLEKGTRLGKEGIDGALIAKEYASKILGKEPYDPDFYSEKIYLTLDYLYKETGFLEGEMKGLSPFWKKISDKVITPAQISLLRDKIIVAATIGKQSPELLGKGKPKTYLLLFQNNMELRPTGGFIGSFGLAGFDGGRFLGVEVFDVYSADGQLKGHVEPPMPIKDHLGEANWYLRDSNWDPDFPTSAARAEWFLDKEMDKAVDGVIGIDLEAAKEILKVAGPVHIPDFDQEIDYKNMYEKTQYEVEKEFFPGSYKKTNFLTALAKELMNKVSKLETEKYFPFLTSLAKSLDERHVQVFVHNSRVQKSVSLLGFDGSVSVPTCSGNCYTDWFGVVDANLGVNKANYFIKRNLSFSAEIKDGFIKRNLTVNYENSANPALGTSGRYKTYTRIMIPQTASVLAVSSAAGEEIPFEVEEISGRKEVGALVEVGPGQSKSATFVWEEGSLLNTGQEGEYRLYVRKQAGTEGDHLELKVSLGELVPTNISPKYSLTPEGSYVYNTLLARDLFSRIIWQ